MDFTFLSLGISFASFHFEQGPWFCPAMAVAVTEFEAETISFQPVSFGEDFV